MESWETQQEALLVLEEAVDDEGSEEVHA